MFDLATTKRETEIVCLTLASEILNVRYMPKEKDTHVIIHYDEIVPLALSISEAMINEAPALIMYDCQEDTTDFQSLTETIDSLFIDSELYWLKINRNTTVSHQDCETTRLFLHEAFDSAVMLMLAKEMINVCPEIRVALLNLSDISPMTDSLVSSH